MFVLGTLNQAYHLYTLLVHLFNYFCYVTKAIGIQGPDKQDLYILLTQVLPEMFTFR